MLQNFTKKWLVWGFRGNPDLAIKLTRTCSRVARSENLRDQAGNLRRYRRLTVKFNQNLSKLNREGTRMPHLHRVMSAFTVGLALGVFAPLSAVADNLLVKFDGGIGAIPVSAGQGAGPTATVVNRNIVRGVQPPAQ